MIAYISGRIIGFLAGNLIIKTTSGLGYQVHVNPNKRHMVNENIEFYILHICREDTQELYGFDQIEDREWVETLMKVNGIGPKMAATMIYTMGVYNIKINLEKKDIEAFCQIKGLGRKTAQKLVLELSGEMVLVDDIERIVAHSDNGNFITDYTEAMTKLGYKRTDIVRTISLLKRDDKWDNGDLLTTIRAGLGVI
jgi:holliday junction DNA helicase RuvA